MTVGLVGLALSLVSIVAAVHEPLQNETIAALHKKFPELHDLEQLDTMPPIWSVAHLVSCRFPQNEQFGNYRYVDITPSPGDLHSHLSVAVTKSKPFQINVAYINVSDDFIETWVKISYVKIPQFGFHPSSWTIKDTALHAPNGKMLPKGVVVRNETLCY